MLPYRILVSSQKAPTIGHKIYAYLSLTSTNDEALRLALNGASHGAIVVSRLQTHGRGSGENIWYSAPGGLYISIILRKNLSNLKKEELLPFSLVVTNSVARAIETVVDLKIKTKWINNLMVDSQKVGGVLLTTEGETELGDFLIVGIGVNANQISFRKDDNITSLRLITSQKISRWRLLQSIALELQNDYALFSRQRFLPFREEYKSRCEILNKEVSVNVGGKRIWGQAIDIDEDGRLVLLTPDQKIIRLISGQI